MNSSRTFLSILIVLSALGIIFMLSIGIRYAYDSISVLETGSGSLILLATIGFLGYRFKQRLPNQKKTTILRGIQLGIPLGLMWAIEIGINNFLTPPLPARDWIDNAFWGVIALSIFIASVLKSVDTRRIHQAIEIGLWSGLVSGLLACLVALGMILFGMDSILRDPLNILEWNQRSAAIQAPSMAAYFAFETLAGALMHLVVLGLIMGALLGSIGGIIGKGSREAQQFLQRISSG